MRSEQIGIVGYDISWINMADGTEEITFVSHAESSYDWCTSVYTRVSTMGIIRLWDA